jgi:PAS fold
MMERPWQGEQRSARSARKSRSGEGARLVGRVEPSASRQVRANRKKWLSLIEPEFLIEGLQAVGLAFGIYDRRDRLVAFNNHYATLRSAIGGDVILGVPWIDLVTASIQAGTIPEALGREKAWLEGRRLARGAYTIIRRTPDSKFFQINERRMLNGAVAVIWTEIDISSTSLQC